MFDSITELLAKIRLGEDSVLELKRVAFRGDRVDGPTRADLADELAAMANTRDGVLVLGVDDKSREILGIPLDKLDLVEGYVREIANDSVHPPLSLSIVKLEVPDEAGDLRALVRVDVPRSLFVHKSPGGYLHRLGSSKRELPPDLLARLFQQRSQARVLHFDEQAVPLTTADDLDERLLERFTAGAPGPPIESARKLNLIVADDTGNTRLSVAGALLCTHHPERWLPGAYIEAVQYRGERQDSNEHINGHRIVGALDEQVAGALAFVRGAMRVSATKGPGRQERAQFSDRAVFEAIVNAIAHRDYSIHGSKIRLFVFADRLELYSPGPLPNTLTIESLRLRQSTRNELLTSLLARCPVPVGDFGRQLLMEKRGDGVPIILDESVAHSGRLPEYRLLDDAELLLTIYAAATLP